MTRYFVHVKDDSHCPDPGHRASRPRRCPQGGAAVRGRAPDRECERFWSTGDWLLTVADAQQLTLFALRLTATDTPAIAGGPAKG